MAAIGMVPTSYALAAQRPIDRHTESSSPLIHSFDVPSQSAGLTCGCIWAAAPSPLERAAQNVTGENSLSILASCVG